MRRVDTTVWRSDTKPRLGTQRGHEDGPALTGTWASTAAGLTPVQLPDATARSDATMCGRGVVKSRGGTWSSGYGRGRARVGPPPRGPGTRRDAEDLQIPDVLYWEQFGEDATTASGWSQTAASQAKRTQGTGHDSCTMVSGPQSSTTAELCPETALTGWTLELSQAATTLPLSLTCG